MKVQFLNAMPQYLFKSFIALAKDIPNRSKSNLVIPVKFSTYFPIGFLALTYLLIGGFLLTILPFLSIVASTAP